MLNIRSDWELVAGSKSDNKPDKRPFGMPINYIMTYMLDAKLLRKICD